MKKYKRIIFHIIILFTVIILTGCEMKEVFGEGPVVPVTVTPTPSADKQFRIVDSGPNYGGSLILPASGEIDSLNPYFTKNRHVIYIASFIYESLFVNSGENDIEPWLVADWDHEGFLTWEFTLKENVTFHGGQEFTAYDVRHTLRVIENSDSPFYYTDILNDIEEFEIISRMRFIIKLKKPDTSFIKKLVFPILSQSAEFQNQDIVSGTGPFCFEGMDEITVSLKKNDNWWYEGLPYFDSVIFRIMPENKIIDAFQNNEIDIAFVKNIDFSKLRYRTNLEYQVYPDNEFNLLYVNPKSLFGKENRQEALFRYIAYRIHDINLEEVQYFEQYGGGFINADEFRDELINSGLQWNRDKKVFIENGRALSTLYVLVPERDMQKLHTANFIVNILEDVGIPAAIRTNTPQNVIRAIRNGNYDLSPVTQELKPWESLDDALRRMQDELGYGKEHSYILPLYRNQQATLFKNYIRGEKKSSFWNPYYGFHAWYMPLFERGE
ncbi:MAG TPA: ABC transporter substrate-binding protein [Ruminiclostridium sp.]|nr:ABC transporter substrate-binding protein [Clostridiaceae bacterium]HAA24716.1 ABC transporter substrate-binding protein [Ruminiclostridium sp.]